MTSPRPGSQRHRPSMWSKARRDLATPQGSSLASAILLCAIVSVVLEVALGRFIKLPKSVVYSAIIIADIAIFIVAAFRVSAMNRRAEEARRELYRQKFERNLEAIRAWSERRSSGTTGTERSEEQESDLNGGEKWH